MRAAHLWRCPYLATLPRKSSLLPFVQVLQHWVWQIAQQLSHIRADLLPTRQAYELLTCHGGHSLQVAVSN